MNDKNALLTGQLRKITAYDVRFGQSCFCCPCSNELNITTLPRLHIVLRYTIIGK